MSAKARSIVARARRVLARLMAALAERDYAPLWHLLAVAVIIAGGCLLFYKSFSGHGTILYTDMPWWSLQRIQFQTVNMWYPYGGFPSINAILWLFWTLPTVTFARLAGISQSTYVFVVYLSTFSLAGVSMYALAFRTIKRVRLENTARYAPYLGAVLAAFVYMYNPWSVFYLRAYYGYPLYALLPLIFLALTKVVERPTLRNLFLFSVLVVFANTAHFLLWFWFLVVTYLIFVVISRKFSRTAVVNSLKALGGILLFYVLMGAAWILPYLGAQISGKAFVPYYAPELTASTLTGLSLHNTIVNNMRLVGFWSWTLNMIKGGTAVQVVTFGLPLLAIVSLLVLRRKVRSNRTVTYWSLIGVIAILLATGTSFILRRPYDYLVFRAPGASSYGWMLRGSEKWLFFVPLFFALMIGLLLARMLVKRSSPVSIRSRLLGRTLQDALGRDEAGESGGGQADGDRIRVETLIADIRYWLGAIVAVVILLLVVLSVWPVTAEMAKTTFSPANVPADYDVVNSFINKTPGEPRVAWLPFFPNANFTYSWAPTKVMLPYSVFNSNPSLYDVTDISDPDSYFTFLENQYEKDAFPAVQLADAQVQVGDDSMSRLLAPFGARYLILDRSVQGYDFGDSFTRERSISLARATKYLSVYNTQDDPGYVWPATRVVKARSFFDNLAVIKNLGTAEIKNLAFTDGRTFLAGPPNIDGKYNVFSIPQSATPQIEDPGFESADPGEWQRRWTPLFNNPRIGVSIDGKVKFSGLRSLKVFNTSKDPWDMGSVVGTGHAVAAGDIVGLSCKVKVRNSAWTQVAVEGRPANSNQWTRLMLCPNAVVGNISWKRFEGSFRVPTGYSQVRVNLLAGWKQDPSRGDAVSWFDDVNLTRTGGEFTQALAPTYAPPRLTFKRLSAEKVSVRVTEATRPFVLVLSETFDKLWQATPSPGKKIAPVPLYSTITGIPVDQPGTFDVTITYRAQRWLTAGMAVSFTTIIIGLLIIGFLWFRRTRWGKAALVAAHSGMSDIYRDYFEGPPRYDEHGNELPKGYHAKRVLGGIGRAARKAVRFLEEPPRRPRE